MGSQWREARIKKGDMGELSDAPYEAGRSIKDRLELRQISRGKTNVDSIAIVYPGADKSVDQSDWRIVRSWRR